MKKLSVFLLLLPILALADDLKVMKPFMEKYCLECHDADVQKGGVSLHDLNTFTEENAALWKQVWEQVSLKEMPPRKKKNQPELLKRMEISNLITSNLTELMKDKGGFTGHLHPLKGNHLDHDLLFNTELHGLEPPSSPARIWRIHPQEHLVRLNDLLQHEPAFDPKRPGLTARGDHIVADARGTVNVYFGLEDMVFNNVRGGENRKSLVKGFPSILSSVEDHGLKNYPYMYTVNNSEASRLLGIAEKIIRYIALGPEVSPEQLISSKKIPKELGGKYKVFYIRDSKRTAGPLEQLMKGSGVDKDLLRKSVIYLFEGLTCRPPTGSETEKYVKLAEKAIKEVGKRDGLIVGLTPVFLDSEALFRSEMASGLPKDSFGRSMLQGHELELALNSAFSYLPPDEKLRQALTEGRLKTPADVKREVTRILNDDSIRKPRILQFFKEYFDYGLCAKICKDEKTLNRDGVSADTHYAKMNDMIVQTDRLVELILQEDKNVLKELLTTDKVVQSSGDGIYFVNLDNFPKMVPPKKKDKGNVGAVYDKSAFTRPSTAVYVRQPKGIGGKTSAAKSLTTLPKTQRMGILTHPSWLISHSDAMDNHAILRGRWIRERLLGDAVPDVPVTVDAMLPDEPHETLRHRMRVTREDECWRCHQKMDPLGLPFEQFNHLGQWRSTEQKKPVDTGGEILFSGEASLDGSVKNPLEMIQKLAASQRVEQVFVRHAFRYWMGRNENINDAPVLREAYKAYKVSGGSLKALLISLLTSDSFLYRKTGN